MNSKPSEEPLIWDRLPVPVALVFTFVKLFCTRILFYLHSIVLFHYTLYLKAHMRWVKVKKTVIRLLMFRGSFFYQTPRLGLFTVVSTTVFSLVTVPTLSPINDHRLVMQVLAAQDTEDHTSDEQSAALAMVDFSNMYRSTSTEKNQSLNTSAQTYVVESGDTISSIAEEYLVSVEALKYANGLSSELIRPGQDLSIPPVNGLVHTVKDGDSISTIASLYGVSGQTIVDFNFLEEPYTIYDGNQLIIPDAKIPQPKPKPVVLASSSGQTAGLKIELLSPAQSGTGGFGMPTSGVFTQYFWWGHTAVDIAASCGTPIYASDSGTVTFAGWWAGGGGNSLFVDHGNGYVTKYAHMSGFERTGGGVQKGEVIGYVGATGRAYGCHVHFIVDYGGQAIDPMSVL